MTDITDVHYKKYLKYKLKYLELKEQRGGGGIMGSSSTPTKIKETLAYFQKKQQELNPQNDHDYRLLRDITPLIHNLIPNLKTELSSEKSDFKLELLDNFVNSPNFKIVIYDHNDRNKKKNNILVNFTTNINNITNIYRNKGSIDNDNILDINIFKAELTNYIDLNLKDMKYKDELKLILTIYLNIFSILNGLKK
jgi:hypothetical protein